MKKLSFDDLNGKVCAITGGAGVIGKALVQGLVSVGVKVAILDINKEMADKMAAEIEKESGVKCIGVEANVLDKASLDKAKSEINEKIGKIDILINGAGGNHPSATTKQEQMESNKVSALEETFYGLQLEGFQKVFDLNFMGTLLPTLVLSKDMLEMGKGAILNISSMNSYKPLTKIPAYSAAKAAINNFTMWLSVHFAKTGIRVNAVAPGFFLTNQNRFLLIDEKTGEATARGKKIISNTPMGRYGEVEELQGTTLFLLSDVSKFITGVVIPVDGGYSAFGGV
ncbi:MAG: SDR family oxidoreductase [Bacteroidales bacterium]|nr:SDR family oxidoreductase [Bacteroidales bacterium]